MTGNKGFTLIEMLVVVVLFSIVIGSAMGALVSSLNLQRYNLGQQQLLSQVSYVSEYMSRMIRMAVIDSTGTCIPSNTNYQILDSNTKIKFKNYLGECQEFYLSGEQLMVNRTGYASAVPMTSDDFTISSIQFISSGASRADAIQPRVTFSLYLIADTNSSDKPLMRIQTTVSQRNLDM